MLRRLGNLIGAILSIFIRRVEGSVPLEERLRYDREQKAQRLKEQMDRATNIGALANEAVAQLAEMRSEVLALREQAKEHVRRAQQARARGDAAEEEHHLALAAEASEELARAEDDLAQFEQDVKDALANKEAAKRMVFEQAEQLQRLARNDARLVRRVQLTEMREASLRLTEEMASIVPEDRDNMRQEIEKMASRRQARYEARKELVDGLLEQRDRAVRARQAQLSAKGRSILAELQAEVGYTPAAAPAETAEATETTEQRRTTAE